MLGYILRRLLATIPVLVIVAVLVGLGVLGRHSEGPPLS